MNEAGEADRQNQLRVQKSWTDIYSYYSYMALIIMLVNHDAEEYSKLALFLVLHTPAFVRQRLRTGSEANSKLNFCVCSSFSVCI